ncbi:MAG: flagellar filament capping protein FliD [Deltaproteobacteria bacterium]|nr:flagellar filament capping protein FliD [Deltaproteobacteria bacterium]
MSLSTNLISGLSSGFDWRSMIDQLMAVEHRRVDIVTAKKTDTETKLTEWQTANSKLLALKTSVAGLKKPDIFQIFAATMSTNSSTVKGSDLLSVSTTTTSAPGTYSLKVTNLAQSQKLSSNPFTSQTTALGAGYAGDIVINGKVVTTNATDTLAGVANSINNLNTGSSPSGVTASVINFGTNDYRLILTSDKTGAEGISLLNGSSVNLVQAFGWKDNQAATIKNAITLGAQGDRFTSATSAVGSLLGLAAGESGSVTIGDKSVAINLSSMSLTDIKIAINTAAPTGASASVIEESVDNITYYRLQIDGTQTFSDANNILNTLGILDRGSTDVSGKVSGVSMTSNGTNITAATVLVDIDGYNTFTTGGFPAGDYLTLTGTDTSNAAVNTNFSITSSTTVQDLLDEIKTRYGNVLAYVTNDGKIRVDDLSGGSVLAVNLTDHIADTNSKLEFVTADADFGTAADRQRQIIAGEDAAIVLDGVTVTNASNTIKDVITGTTLNLIKEDAATTINLTLGRDLDTIKKSIQDYVGKYNDLMSYINTQFSYDTEKMTTGGVLFGDGTLSSIKSDISALTTQTIWGVNSNFSIMGMIGINLDNNQLLTIDDTLLTGYLQTNFNDVKALFTVQGATSSTDLAYIASTKDTKAGDYTVHITTAATQATTTGSVDLSAGGVTDTLTVAQGSGAATIAVTGGMIIADIVNAINTEFNAVYTQTLTGSQELKQDDNVTAITAGTALDNIYGTTLQNGDVINFSGTSRSGTAISGSYTITNTATDTVQDLLSAIETAYSNQVTASISSSGRITLTDKFTGTSQLALDITEPVGRGLDFGTALTSNTGGIVGRYALAMIADDDGSGHLVLRNTDYGSGSSFTISQGLALGLTYGTYSGLDVTGTINGETATGSGQTLTGAVGNANTDGLSIKYTGTTNNIDAGNVMLTLGIAALLDNTLFDITDSVSGYASFKQESLQDSVDSYATQISEMEARLALKQEAMVNRFVAMEMALSKIQSQSSWLTGQINAAYSGWV